MLYHHHWFTRWAWVHRPTHPVGWFFVFLAVLLITHIFLVVDRHAHSASDTLIGVFPWAWIILATLEWIASKTSA